MTHVSVDMGRVQSVEEKIGYTFKDPGLLIHALTHSSAKSKDQPCNERLEFLGDAILGSIISESLFTAHPDFTEGDLSMVKSVVVSASSLASGIHEMGIHEEIIVGKGLARRPELPRSVLSNVFEAIVAGIYLDGGHPPVREFVMKILRARIDEVLDDSHEKNYKSILQDYAQRNWSAIPEYTVIQEVGPDHQKEFQVEASFNGDSYPPAWGPNKKQAEQRAAQQALITLGLEEPESNGSPTQS